MEALTRYPACTRPVREISDPLQLYCLYFADRHVCEDTLVYAVNIAPSRRLSSDYSSILLQLIAVVIMSRLAGRTRHEFVVPVSNN